MQSILSATLTFILLIAVTQAQSECPQNNDIASCTVDITCSWILIDGGRDCTANDVQTNCECIVKIQTPTPTLSPIQESCDPVKDKLDVIILADISCPMNIKQCRKQQELIAETMTGFRGIRTNVVDGRVVNEVRVSYIEYGSTADVIVDLAHDPINENVTNPIQSRMDLYYAIRDSSTACNGDTLQRSIGSNANLYDAIEKAIQEFEEDNTSDNRQLDKKILIISNCGVDETERDRLCDRYEDEIRNGGSINSAGEGIDVIMINNLMVNVNPDTYIMCLVQYDEQKIFSITDGVDYYNTMLPAITNELCERPSPAPTTDPTQVPVSTTTPAPITAAPTTQGPTTQAPTTRSPTTQSPTTKEPTTKSPTTQSPTTKSPTTKVPTTSAPTTLEPTVTITFDRGTGVPTSSGGRDEKTHPPTSPTNAPIYGLTVTLPPNEASSTEYRNTTQVAIIFTTTFEPQHSIIWVWMLLAILLCCYIGAVVFCILKHRKRREEYGYAPTQPQYEQTMELSESDAAANGVLAGYTDTDDADSGQELQQLAVGGSDNDYNNQPEPASVEYQDY